MNGDVANFGTINGRGGGEVVANQDACADLCSAESSCKSYEFSPATKKCSLNTQATPDLPLIQFEDYIFCAKYESTALLFRAKAISIEYG